MHFEGVRALDGVDLELRCGELRGLIGPNGAGKTTMLNVLSGFLKPTSGAFGLDEVDIGTRSPARLCRMGVVRTFQHVRIFADLTVLTNVELGGLGVGLSQREARERAWDLLELMHLEDKAELAAGTISHGDARKVGIARAVGAEPTFLLLDEPGAGLNDFEKQEMGEVIARIRKRLGCGILLVDHDMPLVMRLCETIQVLNFGKTIAVGAPTEIKEDPLVVEAYLGTGSTPKAAATAPADEPADPGGEV